MGKDVSHEGCRYVTRDELLRILRAPIDIEPDVFDRYGGVRGRRGERQEERK
jgi:hypothetical protein